MSAQQVIAAFKELSPAERAQVARVVAEDSGLPARREYSITTKADGLPVIRANSGTITSQLVHELESRTP